jgi:hypothetical protein
MTERACRATTSRLLSQQFIHHEEVKTLAAWGEVTITANDIAIACVPDYQVALLKQQGEEVVTTCWTEVHIFCFPLQRTGIFTSYYKKVVSSKKNTRNTRKMFFFC